MYLLKGTVENDILTISAIYDLSHPRNAWVNQSSGYIVSSEPSPPNEEGYGYIVRYNLTTSAYEYEAYELPKPVEPEVPDENTPTYEELFEATNILMGEETN